MSDTTLPATTEPLRQAVRRMRWFRAAFSGFVAQMGDELGCRFEIDDARLAGAFVRWLRMVEAQKPADRTARRAFFDFATGLMLRELTADMPLTATAPTRAAPQSAAAFWPEGYACTRFCLAMHQGALAQEYGTVPQVTSVFDELRHWWSFRENARDDPAYSIGFMDLILGNTPDWTMPEVFAHRLRAELAAPAPDNGANARLG